MTLAVSGHLPALWPAGLFEGASRSAWPAAPDLLPVLWAVGASLMVADGRGEGRDMSQATPLGSASAGHRQAGRVGLMLLGPSLLGVRGRVGGAPTRLGVTRGGTPPLAPLGVMTGGRRGLPGSRAGRALLSGGAWAPQPDRPWENQLHTPHRLATQSLLTSPGR